MEIDVPSWLTKDFIKSTLEGDCTENEGLTVTDLEIKRAVPKGTNYMSDIFRVKISYHKTSTKKKELSEKYLIIKCPITGGLWELMFKFGIIQKEVLMYKEYIPKLSEVLNEDEQLTPKSFNSNIENTIILEDLNFNGFKMANRLKQLDFSHCKIALKTLGIFHAASVKLKEQDPELIKLVGKELFFNKNLKKENEFMGISQMELILIEISNWPELSEHMDTLRKLPDKMWDFLTECFVCKENRFNVLNHGDFWVTNMLFKYDHNDEPKEMKFIDLQVSRYTTPAIDLIYFFQGSVQDEIRVQKYDDLLNIYLNSLNENLEILRCTTKKLELSELKRTLKECEFYEFYSNITLVPVVIIDTDNVFEIKEMSEKDIKDDLANNPFRKYLQAARYRHLFAKRLTNEFSKHDWYKNLQSSSHTKNN